MLKKDFKLKGASPIGKNGVRDYNNDFKKSPMVFLFFVFLEGLQVDAGPMENLTLTLFQNGVKLCMFASVLYSFLMRLTLRDNVIRDRYIYTHSCISY